MKCARFLMLLTVAGAMSAATNWDNSGNSMLNGEYYFRQVFHLLGDQSGNQSRAIAVYGNIKFNGDGTYSITAAEKAQYADSGVGLGNLITTGTYSIASSGYGFMSSP